jgi:hypothetical protein
MRRWKGVTAAQLRLDLDGRVNCIHNLGECVSVEGPMQISGAASAQR